MALAPLRTGPHSARAKKDQLLRQYLRQFGDDAYEGVLDRVEEAAGRKKVRESATAAPRFRAPAAR